MPRGSGIPWGHEQRHRDRTRRVRRRGVVGAIMVFAITVHTHGFNINTAGWILLIVGVVVFVIGIAIFVTGSRRSSTTVENVQSTPSGQERVEERRDWGSP
jgi:predicted tellurium resistance membrane protein TerC